MMISRYHKQLSLTTASDRLKRQGRRPLCSATTEICGRSRFAVTSTFFSKTGKVHQAVLAIALRLDRANIPYAIAGAMALGAHGYERVTVDVDVLLTREGLARLKSGHGYAEKGNEPLLAVGRRFAAASAEPRRSTLDAWESLNVKTWRRSGWVKRHDEVLEESAPTKNASNREVLAETGSDFDDVGSDIEINEDGPAAKSCSGSALALAFSGSEISRRPVFRYFHDDRVGHAGFFSVCHRFLECLAHCNDAALVLRKSDPMVGWRIQ